jgi:hypothetical protein
MTKDQAVAEFGTQVKLAEALGIKSQGSVAAWGEYPPPLRQLQIEALTGGKLKAEPDCDKFRFPPAPAPAEPAPQAVAQ